MVDKDKPTVNFSYSQFEDSAPEPYVYVTKANKRVTFPDIFAMEAEEAEQFLMDFNNTTVPDSVALQKWLSKTDYDALKADKLSLRFRSQLLESVMNYYERSFGSSGEESTSAS